MSNAPVTPPRPLLDAPLRRLARGGMALGALAVVAGVALGRAQPTLGALAASWLFFAGLAAGGVALSAAVRVAQGTWAQQILPVAEAASAFFTPAAAILVVLVGAARWWMPGLAAEGVGAWLALAARDLLAMAALFVAARRYLQSSRAGAPTATRDAIVYLFAYVLALTLWAIDLVMGLRPWAPSTVVPPFYFMGALLAAVAWSALLTSIRPESLPPEAARVDLAKLLFGLSILWFYLFFSGFLPTWYANIPDETGQLLARWRGGYRPISIAVIATIFVLPFGLLLRGSAKRRPARVAVGAASVLVGLVGERFLLVMPSLDAGGAWPAVAALGVTLGLAGAFLLGVDGALSSRVRPA